MVIFLFNLLASLLRPNAIHYQVSSPKQYEGLNDQIFLYGYLKTQPCRNVCTDIDSFCVMAIFPIKSLYSIIRRQCEFFEHWTSGNDKDPFCF